jgi:hypothetical protein
MTFAAVYRTKATTSEETEARSLELFSNWSPPFEFTHHWARADGDGGIAIFEADDAAVVLEGIAPWVPFFDFDVVPVVGVEEAMPLFAKVNAWRDSVS